MMLFWGWLNGSNKQHSGLAQQNLRPKAKILYGAFLYVNIN